MIKKIVYDEDNGRMLNDMSEEEIDAAFATAIAKHPKGNLSAASIAASIMGKIGGSRKSAAKTKACSRNGKLGGWPKGKKRPPKTPTA